MANTSHKKKHVCPECARAHVDSLPIFPVRSFTYSNRDGNVYIDAYSVFNMFTTLGLDKHALEFMKQIADVRKKKE